MISRALPSVSCSVPPVPSGRTARIWETKSEGSLPDRTVKRSCEPSGDMMTVLMVWPAGA
jgi:hypothetical protein